MQVTKLTLFNNGGEFRIYEESFEQCSLFHEAPTSTPLSKRGSFIIEQSVAGLLSGVEGNIQHVILCI